MKLLLSTMFAITLLIGCGDDDAVDAAIDGSLDAHIDASDTELDATIDVTTDVSQDVAPDTILDDATADTAEDAVMDTMDDAAMDAMTDATVDAVNDAVDADTGTFRERYCRARQAFALRCNEPAVDTDACELDPFLCSLETMLTEANKEPFVTCHQERTCGTPETECARAATLGVPPTPSAEAYTMACATKRMQCGSPTELTCAWEILNAASQQLLDDCLGLDCSKVGQCSSSRFLVDTCGQP